MTLLLTSYRSKLYEHFVKRIKKCNKFTFADFIKHSCQLPRTKIGKHDFNFGIHYFGGWRLRFLDFGNQIFFLLHFCFELLLDLGNIGEPLSFQKAPTRYTKQFHVVLVSTAHFSCRYLLTRDINCVGPFRLPIFGNALTFMAGRRKPPFVMFRDLCHEYGPITFLKFGSQNSSEQNF